MINEASRTSDRVTCIRALTAVLEPEVGFEPTTFRLRVECSASAWTAPEGSRLLTLDASSVQTAPDGYRRIVWMINRHPTEQRCQGKHGRPGLTDHQGASDKNRMPRRATLVVDHRTPAITDRLVHPPDRVDRLTAGQRPSRLVLGQLPLELAPHSTARLSPNSSSSNSWRSSISPSASGSPPASNGSRLAQSMASSIDIT